MHGEGEDGGTGTPSGRIHIRRSTEAEAKGLEAAAKGSLMRNMIMIIIMIIKTETQNTAFGFPVEILMDMAAADIPIRQ